MPTPKKDVDSRTKPARQLRQLIEGLTADLGGDLTEAEQAFVKIAAANLLRAGELTDALGRGEQVDDAELVRMSNTASRIVRDLRDAKDKRPAAPASAMTPMQQLEALVAARKAERAAEAAANPAPDDDADPEAGWTPAMKAFAASKAARRADPDDPDNEPAFGSVLTPQPVLKPRPAITVAFDPRPRSADQPQGRTLIDVVGELQSSAPNARITFTGGAFSRDDMTVTDLANELGPNPWHLKGSTQLIGRADWFVRP